MATTWDTVVRGTGGNDDLGSTSTTDSQLIMGGGGDDVLRGGKGDDRLVGGAGDDIMSGGAGADQFYFKGSDVASGTTDTDRVVDLSFAQGDTLLFDQFGANYFGANHHADGLTVTTGGADAIVSSYAGLHSMVDSAGGAVTVSGSAALDLLILTFNYGSDQTEVIRLSHAYADYFGAPSA